MKNIKLIYSNEIQINKLGQLRLAYKFFYFSKAISWTTGCHRYGAIGMCWFYILKNKFEIHVIYFNDNLYPHIS